MSVLEYLDLHFLFLIDIAFIIHKAVTHRQQFDLILLRCIELFTGAEI